MMAPAHNPGILSLDELVAWLRNSSLRRIQKVATYLSKPSPSQHGAQHETLPAKMHPTSGQTSRNRMPKVFMANPHH